ncbi:MAG: hypothetical protein HC837_14215 [Chloroflexaceae bacterium]|nr:hypothetical protein [Chloroflexaceae bacterium]
MIARFFQRHQEEANSKIDTTQVLTPEQARRLIEQGTAPVGLQVQGRLGFRKECHQLDLPANLTVTSLDLHGLSSISLLPPGLTCYDLDASGTALRSLPTSLRVEFRLDLSNCMQLATLGTGLKVGSLILRNCTALTALPEGLDVYFLDITGCTSLTDWPQEASIRIGRLTARGCIQLHRLPPWLTNVSQLDLRDCISLSELPETLCITSWIELANTRITRLPKASEGVQIRWKGVPIDERIAFQPETITADEVLRQSNVERRRVLLERMGYDSFLSQANAQIIDTDEDPGGERRLLLVPMSNDEDLMCLAVYCPSTGRQYVLRVPPGMKTCHQAAAWIAGYDNPKDYKPMIET